MRLSEQAQRQQRDRRVAPGGVQLLEEFRSFRRRRRAWGVRLAPCVIVVVLVVVITYVVLL